MNAGDQTTVSAVQVAAFERAASAAADRLSSMLTKLVSDLAPLDSNWVGQGGQAFRSTSSTVQTEATRMTTALRGIAADVGTAGRNYAAADAEQEASMNRVNSATTGITSSLIV